jgi:hypothetical protein
MPNLTAPTLTESVQFVRRIEMAGKLRIVHPAQIFVREHYPFLKIAVVVEIRFPLGAICRHDVNFIKWPLQPIFERLMNTGGKVFQAQDEQPHIAALYDAAAL